jgi:tetratricopeptide (TPR) repeat protein
LTAEDLPRLFDEADASLAEGNFQQALLQYSRILPLAQGAQPTTLEALQYPARAHAGIGRSLAGLQEFDDALEAYTESLNSFENYLPALIGRGEVYLQMNAPANALAEYQKAVKERRDSIDALFGLGKSYVLVGQVDRAIRPLTAVIDHKENRYLAEAHRLRGTALSVLDKNDEAATDFQASLSIDREAHETYFEIGVFLLRLKEYGGAVEQFGNAIIAYTPPPGQAGPYVVGHLAKAAAHMELGKAAPDEATRMAAYQGAVDEANKLYSQVDEESRLTAGIRAQALLTRGIAERMLRKVNEAIRTLSRALELNPAASEAYFRRGICLLEIGENKMAIADFLQAAAINYEDPRNNLWEGFVYAKMGNYHEAVRAYGDAIAASDRFTPAYVNRGLAYMMLGEDDKAINDFNDALRIEPTNGDLYFKRGVAYAQLGDLQRASDSLASAIEFAPAHREAYRSMADVQQRLGRAELAAQYRQKAAELDAAQGSH